jgi:acetyl-CoA acyltransferase
MIHLMHEFAENPKAKYGLATMCVGLGQGGSVIWENLQGDGKKTPKKKAATKRKKK